MLGMSLFLGSVILRLRRGGAERITKGVHFMK